ncbi:MAG: endonuclease/exonuclease/phosphatase family protein [Acidimicrobiia bacterium]
MTLRVVTFNIRHAEGPDGCVDLGQLARDCVVLDADVLALQEVDCFVWRSGLRHQARVLARKLGVRHEFVAASRRHWFGRFGNAFFTRGEARDVERRHLPGQPGRESRAVLLGRVVAAGLEVSVAATHLQARHQSGGSPAAALTQLDAAVDALNRRPPPRVLLGDFNLGSEEAEPVLTAGGLEVAPSGPTFPAREPRVRIDYVAFSGLAVEQVEVAHAAVSDHRPLVVDLARL